MNICIAVLSVGDRVVGSVGCIAAPYWEIEKEGRGDSKVGVVQIHQWECQIGCASVSTP